MILRKKSFIWHLQKWKVQNTYRQNLSKPHSNLRSCQKWNMTCNKFELYIWKSWQVYGCEFIAKIKCGKSSFTSFFVVFLHSFHPISSSVQIMWNRKKIGESWTNSALCFTAVCPLLQNLHFLKILDFLKTVNICHIKAK